MRKADLCYMPVIALSLGSGTIFLHLINEEERLIYLLRVPQEVAEAGFEPRQFASTASPPDCRDVMHLTLLSDWVSWSTIPVGQALHFLTPVTMFKLVPFLEGFYSPSLSRSCPSSGEFSLFDPSKSKFVPFLYF